MLFRAPSLLCYALAPCSSAVAAKTRDLALSIAFAIYAHYSAFHDVTAADIAAAGAIAITPRYADFRYTALRLMLKGV